jgi:hypothetical protein
MYRPQDKGGATLRDRAGVLNWQKDDDGVWPGKAVGWQRACYDFRTTVGLRVGHAVDGFRSWYGAGKIALADGAP